MYGGKGGWKKRTGSGFKVRPWFWLRMCDAGWKGKEGKRRGHKKSSSEKTGGNCQPRRRSSGKSWGGGECLRMLQLQARSRRWGRRSSFCWRALHTGLIPDLSYWFADGKADG